MGAARHAPVDGTYPDDIRSWKIREIRGIVFRSDKDMLTMKVYRHGAEMAIRDRLSPILAADRALHPQGCRHKAAALVHILTLCW